MTLHEIYSALGNRMVGAMMIHSQLVQIFAFVDLLPDMRKQESQLQEETHGFSELCKYYIQHHHNILVADNPPQIDILNLGMLKKSSEELTTEDKMYIIKYGMHEWIEWEKQSKILYEDCYRGLVDISEVASAEFVMRFVKDVDLELKEAERIFRVREGINWNLDTIYDKQSRDGEPRLTSRAISTPAAAEQFNSVTSPATIKVPRGCCFTLAVEYVSGITDGATVPTPVIDQINGNLEINRIA